MGEWISVKDRLPAENSEVWICGNNGKTETGRYSTQHHPKGWAYCALPSEAITHWMPIEKPEPPEECRPLKLNISLGGECAHYGDIDYLLATPTEIQFLKSINTRREVAALIPVLQRFVDTGSIKEAFTPLKLEVILTDSAPTMATQNMFGFFARCSKKRL